MAEQTATGMKKTLGLTGVTVNAMALIAPGAFLWLTFQLQALPGDPNTLDIWTGIVAALILAFLTAFACEELARRYPEAGRGGAYYFAEKALLDREEPSHRRWARVARFITGWAAHLFYWVYPAAMVAFMATLVVYILGQFGVDISTSIPVEIVICIVFAALVGFIAMRGISGSTNVAIAINVIQLTALVVFSVLCLAFRAGNPLKLVPAAWYHPTASSIVLPHNFGNILIQSTIAILILVGFESSTALAAEAKDPKKDIPRGVILSLVIQGLFAYLFEYFAASYAMNNALTSKAADGTVLTGMAAAANSGAPIGDMAIQIGNALVGGNGFALMVILAITVAIAILGTTLAAMNTGVRISFAMAQDKEMPEVMGLLHGKYATPYMGVVIMVIFCAIVGSVGVIGGGVTLTAVALASNIGTFILYAMICLVTIVAFIGTKNFNVLKHGIVPGLGLLMNVAMLFAIVVLNIQSGGTTQQATLLALGIAGVWRVVSVAYMVITSAQRGTHIIPPVSAMTGTTGSGS